MGKGGNGVPMSKLIQAVRPVKTEETVSHRQNNDVKEVGTPPVPSSSVYSATRFFFKSCSEQSHKDGVRKAAVEEQLGSKVGR